MTRISESDMTMHLRSVTREVGAVFAKDGPRLTFWWDGAGTTTGTVEGTTFTMDNEGMVFVYRR